jgi:hypothetical protein
MTSDLTIKNQGMKEVMPNVTFDWKNKTVSFKEGMKFEEGQAAIDMLCEVEDATPWMIGDALNSLEAIFGEKYSQAMKATGKKYDTLLHYCNIAARYAPQERVKGVLFTHHRAVAYIDPDLRQTYLEKAAREEMSVEELKRTVWKDMDKIPSFRCGVCRKTFENMEKTEVQTYRTCRGCDKKLRKMK